MKQLLKNTLKAIGVYQPLQSYYHQLLFSNEIKKYRREYQQYAGSGFTCNVCGAVYSKFVPDRPSKEDKAALENNNVIAGYCDNCICPNCLSTARERLVIAYLEDKADVGGKKILHFSPEKYVYQYLKKNASVTTCDLSPGLYKSIDKAVKKQDATNLSFNNESFDMVIANHILEHIPDDTKAMKEFFRVLKPGGMAILQVPYSESLPSTIEDKNINDPAKQSALFGQVDHVRIYAMNDYIKRLQSVGFSVESMPVEEYGKYATQLGEKVLKIVKPR